MVSAFMYGVLLSFSLIMPLGMQNFFIFNQGATQPHFLYALPSVLTAFVCDTCLILGAVLGISLVVLTIPWLKNAIFIGGFLFLIYMGLTLWNRQTDFKKPMKPLSAKRQIAFAASVSILNPHAFLDTVSVIGTNSLHFNGQEKWLYTLACILVSFCWFLFLSIIGHFFKKMDKTGTGTKMVNKLSAVIMWLTASYLLWSFISAL